MQQDREEDSVYYCRGCLSLRIKIMYDGEKEIDYCEDCGSTSIACTPFVVYQKICKRRGKELVKKTKKPVR